MLYCKNKGRMGIKMFFLVYFLKALYYNVYD